MGGTTKIDTYRRRKGKKTESGANREERGLLGPRDTFPGRKKREKLYKTAQTRPAHQEGERRERKKEPQHIEKKGEYAERITCFCECYRSKGPYGNKKRERGKRLNLILA